MSVCNVIISLYKGYTKCIVYDTNGLTLNDLYPYGEQNGDTAMTNGDLPIAPLLEPIDNIIELGSHGLTATRYQVRIKSSV